ncbi:RNA polymerase sigma factor [Syntrophobacter sp. SbD1]|nr:RNA polymerase sigma factor [Syntrophobacter sp. SbD1]
MKLPEIDVCADDAEAIAAILDGDVNAYSTLVLRYQGAIFNLMYRMSGSYEDAADLAQETFIKAYDQLYRFQKGKKFFPWLYTIGLNHARNFLRDNKRSRLVALDDYEAGSGLDYPGQQEENIVVKLDYEQLYAALNQLPLDYREALMLRYHEGLPMEDVAEALSLKLSAAKMRVHRGLAKLRDILENNHDGKGRA